MARAFDQGAGPEIQPILAAKLVEDVTGNAWATDAHGRFMYVTPASLEVLGLTLDILNAAPGDSAFGWKHVIHPADYEAAADAWRRCLETGEPYVVEHRMLSASGVYSWARCSGRPSYDPQGQIAGWYGTVLDRGALESERSMRDLVETLPARIWCTTPGGEPFYFSRQLREYYGFNMDAKDEPDQSRLGNVLSATIHPADLEIVGASFAHSLATGEPYSVRHRQLRHDGVYRWVQTHATAMRDDAGEILRWNGVNFDIDDLVTAQDALRERERELSQLVNMVPSHIWRLSPEGEPVFFNKRMVDFLRREAADLNRHGGSGLQALIDAVHPDDAAAFSETLRQSLATGKSFAMQYRLRRADGEYRWMSGRAEPLRDDEGIIVQWFGLCHDIDDQMRLYRELADREAKIRRLVDSDIIGIVIWDLNGALIDANDAFLRMVQYDRADVEAGIRWLEMTPPEWQEVHAREEAEELARTGKMQPREKEYFRKDGSRVPILIGGACFEGQTQQGVAFILDLTEQKRSEEALRESERSLRDLVETLPAMIDCASPAGEPVFRSRGLREFLGYDLEDLSDADSRLAATLDSGVHPDDLAGVKTAYAHSLATGEPYARRHRLRRFDGEYRWVETRAAPMRNTEGVIVQWNVVCLDIETEVRAQEDLRLAQNRLARASQAASLAELSASIAHEVNQPLAAIVANSQACQRWLSAEPANLERAQITLERIVRDANAASAVVGRVRGLFKQETPTQTRLALGPVITEAQRLLADVARARDVPIETAIEELIPDVRGDPVQIQQVLINLMRNGIEATTAGARKALRVAARRDGDVARIEIADEGAGIAEPDRVFDPFFTTKQDGLGMGLAISRSIVEAHGGSLTVESRPGAGTRFTFTLPLADRAAA